MELPFDPVIPLPEIYPKNPKTPIKKNVCTHMFIAALFKIAKIALAGVAQWDGHHPANQKVTGSIPSQGTCLGCRPGPQLGACERQLIDVSLVH